MKKIFGLFILFLFTIVAQAQILELKDILDGKYRAKGVKTVISSADGEFYYQADNANKKIIKYAYKTGEAVETVFDASTARNISFSSFQGFIMSPDEKRILLYNDYESVYRHSFKANYYYYDIRRNHIRKLTENTSKQMTPTFSRDGRMLAYVMDNNLWLAKFDFESESQITFDGQYGRIINGATDWVYEEEFGTTGLIDFSADSRLLAFVRFDETDVQEFSIPMYGNNLYPSYFSFKYPKAGEKNSKVSCHVFDIDAKTTRLMNIPAGVEYIPRIEFLPSGDELAIMTLNRNQNDFNMYFADGRSTVSRLILREQNDKYVDSELLNSIEFYNDRFTYISEKSGYNHIYIYNTIGEQLQQATSGDYDVTKLLAIDPTSDILYYESAEEGPLYRTICKVDLKKNKITKLSGKTGYNTATFSRNGKYYINKYTNLATPGIYTMNDASGKELRILESNAELNNNLAKTNKPTKEFITVKGADGTTLNGYIVKPANFNTSQKYPLLMVQYSGPNSQQVTDSYGVDWTDYLVSQGFIVACVDGRGTGARGEAFRKCTYMNLGVKESDDQAAAARHFASLPYIDSNRIAIWGWSYGGYNVLMSMSRGGGIFKAGIAVAPVTDWKFYDTVYAERYMRTPQQNADGYDATSPIKLAGQLEGKLLLMHGNADDNVHFQNTVSYTTALLKANKQFELFMYPDQDHGIGAYRMYLFEKTINFLKNM